MYGLMYGLSQIRKKRGPESKKPPEGGCAWCVPTGTGSVQVESVLTLAVVCDVVLPDQVATEDVLNTLATASLLRTVDGVQDFTGGNPTPSVFKLLEQIPYHGNLPSDFDGPWPVCLGGDDQRIGVRIEANRK